VVRLELQGVYAHLLLCNGKSCIRQGAEEVTKAIRDEIRRQGLNRFVHTTKTMCNGRCQDSCTVVHYPRGNWYKQMTPEKGRELVRNLQEHWPLQTAISYKYDGTCFTHFAPKQGEALPSLVQPDKQRVIESLKDDRTDLEQNEESIRDRSEKVGISKA
jgi:(2Fe-2S) ferredoxin